MTEVDMDLVSIVLATNIWLSKPEVADEKNYREMGLYQAEDESPSSNLNSLSLLSLVRLRREYEKK